MIGQARVRSMHVMHSQGILLLDREPRFTYVRVCILTLLYRRSLSIESGQKVLS